MRPSRALGLVLVAACTACGGPPALAPCAAADGGLAGTSASRPLVIVGDRVSDRIELYAGAPLARAGCMSVDENPSFVDEPFDLAPVGGDLLVVLGHADHYARGTLVRRRLVDGAKLGEVTLGEEPSMIAVTADGKRAFVTLFRNLAHPRGPWTDPGALVAVDLERMQVTGAVDVCGAALGVALDEAHARAWVACLGGDAVAMVDTDAMSVTQTIPLGAGTGPAYLARDDAHVFVTTQFSGELVVLDGATGDVATRIPFGSGSFPQRLALVPGKPLLLVDVDGASQLGVVATDALLLLGTVPLAGIHPQGIALSSDGNTAWVSDEGDLTNPGRVVQLDVSDAVDLHAPVVATAATAVFPQAVRVVE